MNTHTLPTSHPHTADVGSYSVPSRMPRGPTTTIASDRLDPGRARQARVHGPVRASLVNDGIYRPANRWRQTSRSGSHSSFHPANRERNILQRPLLLAKQLPWLHKYNYARS